MISDTAKIAFDEMVADGLRPTFEDAVRLNALGLKVDRGEMSNDFSTLPRIAFIGDRILHEPTVAKRIWLDEAARIIGDDYFSRLCLTAFALNAPADELPSIEDATKVKSAVSAFRDDVIASFTQTEIEAAIDYVLRGAEPDADEYPEPTAREIEEANKVREMPDQIRSAARAMIARALSVGVSTDLVERSTMRHAEDLVSRALIIKGPEIANSVHMDNLGHFYRTADLIRERLQKEKENGEGKH